MFKKYESFNPCNPIHVELLKNHQFYCAPGTGITIIGETDQPERLNEPAQCPNCTLEDECDVCWAKYLETLGCDSLNTVYKND